MQKQDKIFVAGASGMVGSAITKALQAKGYTNIIGSYRSRKPDPSLITDHSSLVTYKLDLTDQSAVKAFFLEHQPDLVVLAAAKVGGIMANNIYRADFIYQNLIMETNIIQTAYEHGVVKLLFLGSSCIYPKLAEQPMREDVLLTGPLEPTNEPYAIAKIAGIRLCDAFNRQYGTNFVSAMPTNLYGPGDNFDLETSHVLPALIRKFHLGKCLEQSDWDALRADLNARPIGNVEGNASKKEILQALSLHGIELVTGNSSLVNGNETCSSTNYDSQVTSYDSLVTISLWGTGSPLREFLHVDDLASACVFLMEKVNYQDIAFTDDSGTVQAHVNIGSGQEISIYSLAELVKEVVGFQGEVVWDTNKPDGTPRKLMDSERLRNLGWEPEISLYKGIKSVYNRYHNQLL